MQVPALYLFPCETARRSHRMTHWQPNRKESHMSTIHVHPDALQHIINAFKKYSDDSFSQLTPLAQAWQQLPGHWQGNAAEIAFCFLERIMKRSKKSMFRTALFTPSRVLCRLLVRCLIAILLAAACALALLHPAVASGHPLTPKSCGGACCLCERTVYVHYATAANTTSSWTDLDNSITNTNPSASVYVTRVWNPGGVSATAFDWASVGVWYNTATNKWSIFNEDNSPMPVGTAFNVYAITGEGGAPYDYPYFVSPATAATISGSSFDITGSHIDGQPNVDPSSPLPGTASLIIIHWACTITMKPATGLSSMKMGLLMQLAHRF